MLDIDVLNITINICLLGTLSTDDTDSIVLLGVLISVGKISWFYDTITPYCINK